MCLTRLWNQNSNKAKYQYTEREEDTLKVRQKYYVILL